MGGCRPEASDRAVYAWRSIALREARSAGGRHLGTRLGRSMGDAQAGKDNPLTLFEEGFLAPKLRCGWAFPVT